MKQAEDKFTADMVEVYTGKYERKRGRPPAANPLTEAQRKRQQRARRKVEGVESITVEVSAAVVAAIKARCEATATRPKRTQREVVEEILKNQLMRKR